MKEKKLSPSHGRILLVSDGAVRSGNACEWLRTTSHEILLAADGRAAIELTCEVSPNCIVLDLAELGVHALQIARRIRQLQLPRQPLLVAAAGRHEAYDRVIAEDAGFDVSLEIPIELPVLTALLQADHTQAPERASRPSSGTPRRRAERRIRRAA